MECRSAERRQWIVNIFYATDKASGKREIIQCGIGVATDYGEGNIPV